MGRLTWASGTAHEDVGYYIYIYYIMCVCVRDSTCQLRGKTTGHSASRETREHLATDRLRGVTARPWKPWNSWLTMEPLWNYIASKNSGIAGESVMISYGIYILRACLLHK